MDTKLRFFQLLIRIIIVTVMVVVIVIVTIMVIVIVACKTLVTVSAPSNDLIHVPGSLSVCVSAMSNHYPGIWVLFPCPYHRPVQSPSRSQGAFPLSLSLICFVLILVSGLFSLVPVSAPVLWECLWGGCSFNDLARSIVDATLWLWMYLILPS